jgi:hypothetical protein
MNTLSARGHIAAALTLLAVVSPLLALPVLLVVAIGGAL